MDNTLWQTYKIAQGPKAKIPALEDTQTGETYFSDQEKAEAIVNTFAATHEKAYHIKSPLDQ